MKQLILESVGFLEILGTGNMIILTILMLVFSVLLIYVSIVAESYIQAGSIQYGKYNVVVKDVEKGIETKMIVRSFGKIHAIERAAKKLGRTENIAFKVTKVAKVK